MENFNENQFINYWAKKYFSFPDTLEKLDKFRTDFRETFPNLPFEKQQFKMSDDSSILIIPAVEDKDDENSIIGLFWYYFPTKNFTAFIKYIESKLGRPIILEKYNSNLVNHAIENVGRLHGQLPNEKHSESDFYHYIFSRWKTNFEYISTPLHNKMNSGIRLFGLTLPVQFSLHDGKRLVEELNHLPEFR
jgi:hypothetical protein